MTDTEACKRELTAAAVDYGATFRWFSQGSASEADLLRAETRLTAAANAYSAAQEKSRISSAPPTSRRR